MSTGFIRGEFNGIKPYEGNQMYGIASGLEVNDGRGIAESRGSFSLVEPPATEISIAFFVSQENARCHTLEFAAQRGGTRALSSTINLGTGAWSFLDDDQRHRSGTTSINVGSWNTIKHRYDWAANKITVMINGLTVVTGFAAHFFNGNDRLTGGYIAVNNRVEAGPPYAFPIGGPPLYVDGYRLTNVPEPAGALSLLGLFLGMRFRRSQVRLAR